MKTKMYKVLKIKLSYLINQKYNIIKFTDKQRKKYTILQQDNSIFRNINKLNNNSNKVIGKHEFIDDIIFLNIDRSVTLTEWELQKRKDFYKEKYDETGKEKYKEYVDGNTALDYLLRNGFIYSGVRYRRFGKSSSMARNATIAFVSERVFDKLFSITTMGIDLCKPMVLSKFEAYRGLLFSSSIVVQKDLPYIVLIDDFDKYIPNQKIKYTIEEDGEYVNKTTGEIIKTKKYPIMNGIDSVKISCFDGMGIHEQCMEDKIEKVLGDVYPAVQIRAPYMKGLSVKFSFRQYFKDVLHRDYIIDVFNIKHNIDDVECIYIMSMWKGSAYFKSWSEYKQRFSEFEHEFCISKNSRHTEEETLYTRSNFQYLQSLTKLTKEKILEASEYSKNYIKKIVDGDLLYATRFLGLSENEGDSTEKIDSYYMEAVKINPDMLYDKAIQKSIYNLLLKTINGFKLGRLFINAHYSMVYGDLKLFIEHAAGLKQIGILKEGEFYSPTYEGNYTGFRSPMVHKSEINRMRFIKNEWLNTWCSHLDNLVMLNGYDITMPRMGGMDQDGDIIWVTKDDIIYNSIEDEDIAVVVDKDDKALGGKILYNIDNLIEYERRTLSQRIGDITNKSTGLCNQTPESDKSKKYIDDQMVFFRLAQGHEIDSIKTGTKYEIAAYYKNIKLPYFLIYRYPREKAFYNKIKKDNKEKSKKGQQQDRYNISLAHSPMNELCWHIEKWQRKIINNFNLASNNETYKLLMNNNASYNEDDYWIVKNIYNEFNSDYADVLKENKDSKDLDKYIMSLYDDYKDRVDKLSINKTELTNYCVLASYVKDKQDLEKEDKRIAKAKERGKRTIIYDKSSKFAWIVVPNEMIKNLKSNSKENNINIVETIKDDENSFECLGRYYKIIKKGDLLIAE